MHLILALGTVHCLKYTRCEQLYKLTVRYLFEDRKLKQMSWIKQSFAQGNDFSFARALRSCSLPLFAALRLVRFHLKTDFLKINYDKSVRDFSFDFHRRRKFRLRRRRMFVRFFDIGGDVATGEGVGTGRVGRLTRLSFMVAVKAIVKRERERARGMSARFCFAIIVLVAQHGRQPSRDRKSR